MSKIVAVRKATDGDLLMFKLDNGEVLDYQKTVRAIRDV